MWSPTRKVKVAILKSVFRSFETNNENKFEQKIRHFFYNVGNFFQKFLMICRIRKV
jgi:hypothetical protein